MASGDGELSDRACDIADPPASFKSDWWKHFGFPVPGTRDVTVSPISQCCGEKKRLDVVVDSFKL